MASSDIWGATAFCVGRFDGGDVGGVMLRFNIGPGLRLEYTTKRISGFTGFAVWSLFSHDHGRPVKPN